MVFPSTGHFADSNVPDGNQLQLFAGQPVIFGSLVTRASPQVKPTTQLGYIKNVKFAFDEKYIDFMQGFPETLMLRLMTAKTGSIEFDGYQLHLPFMQLLDGGTCVITSTPNMDIWGIGCSITEKAHVKLMLHHTTINRRSLWLEIWDAQGGPLSLGFDDTNFSKIPYKFTMNRSLLDFEGEPTITRAIDGTITKDFSLMGVTLLANPSDSL